MMSDVKKKVLKYYGLDEDGYQDAWGTGETYPNPVCDLFLILFIIVFIMMVAIGI